MRLSIVIPHRLTQVLSPKQDRTPILSRTRYLPISLSQNVESAFEDTVDVVRGRAETADVDGMGIGHGIVVLSSYRIS